VNEGIFVWELITISECLSISQASNQVVGKYIMNCVLISSLRSLMKHYLENELDIPSM
jgi:hypothetical protein